MAIVDNNMMIIVLVCVSALLSARNTVTADEHCFTFYGNSYLVFSPDAPFSNKNSAHFEFEFNTDRPDGLLMYARGDNRNYDTEAVYIRDGRLHYHLFNTGGEGIGGEFGAHFVSTETVDGSGWIKVHVYRSKETVSMSRHSRDSGWKTGIEFELDGSLRSYVDGHRRHNIDISNTIYFGGYRHAVSNAFGNFTGQIRGIREHTNGHTFENPSLNYKSQVELNCFTFTPQ